MPRSARAPWALLGDIEFELSQAPEQFDISESTRYVEIPRIEQQPTLQWVGDELRQISWDFVFNVGWCNPSEQLRRLQAARLARKPLPLTLSTGVFTGNYLITQLSTEIRRTLADGTLLSIEVSVDLLETTEQPEPETVALEPFLTRAA